MPPRAGEMSHAQLFEQINLRISDIVIHIDRAHQAQNERIGQINDKLDAHGETLTDLSVAVAKLQATETAREKADDDERPRDWRKEPLWKRIATYGAISAALVAIFGGISSAWREVVALFNAINTTLINPPH